MNFLAHAYLAADDDALIAGGVVGDWIKGPLAGSSLPEALLRGVALHRAIDSFADRDPAFLRSRARISTLRRRWSGVLIDMYYDHLLAAHWKVWHDQPLADFTQRTYAALEAHRHAFDERTQAAMRLMRDEDWLARYASIEDLAAILGRMSRRARQPNPLADGALELIAAEADFAADFAAFMPAATAFAQDWISRAQPISESA
jgi:acyl carrier protein phosphodiesterase